MRIKPFQLFLSAVLLLNACGEAEEPAAHIDLLSIEKKNQQVSAALLSSDWKGLSALFSNHAKHKSRRALSSAWEETGASACTLEKSDQVKEEGRTAGYLTFACSEGKELAVIDYDDALKITSLIYEKLPDAKNVESTPVYTEQLITIGTRPAMQGILTMPAGASYPPVAILMPEGAADEMDASGTDSTFRKDLAHALASSGIASVRYDMRAYEDPSILRPSLLSFGRLYGHDLAWCVHHLETYPVDASTILYIGHGAAGTLGYQFVHEHYEISGGMVLLNARYENGLQLMSDVFSVPADDIKAAQQELASADEEKKDYIGTYPLSFYEEWKEADPLNYTASVSIPVAILQGEKDTISTMPDFEKWKSRKGISVSMKSYSDLGHFMRDSKGSISQEVLDDIQAWLNGEDIEKEDSEETGEEADES